jgi:hypothetical protein
MCRSISGVKRNIGMRRSQKSGGAVAVTDARLRLGQTSRAFDPDVIHPEHKEKQAAFSKNSANSRPFSPEVVYPRPLNPRLDGSAESIDPSHPVFDAPVRIPLGVRRSWFFVALITNSV